MPNATLSKLGQLVQGSEQRGRHGETQDVGVPQPDRRGGGIRASKRERARGGRPEAAEGRGTPAALPVPGRDGRQPTLAS